MASRILKYLTVVLSCMMLAGCASLPVHKGPSYSLDDIYKRLSYKTDGDYRVVDIFYATSREGSKPKLAKETAYGTLNIRIDPRVRIGTMLPDQLKSKGILELRDTNKLEPDAFIKRLSAAIQASPHKSLLVLIFGYKDGFEATAMKAAYFAYLLDVDTPVLLFDWPGDQPVSIGGYMKAQSLASASGPYLAEVLAKVIREAKPEKVWIEASSLGCQVACDAFGELYKYPDFVDIDTEIDHVILAAPDVGSDEFRGKFKDELMALSNKLTVYVSSDDNALLMSGFINGEKKLGRVKLRVKDPEQLEEARALLYLKSLAPERLTVIDVTPINNASFKHGYYLECPGYYDDFYMRIFDTEPRINRHLYLLKTAEGADYWVMQDPKE
ncbi:MAG: alpha/beta hydrolase [Candidatus Omnitrophota bacterium]